MKDYTNSSEDIEKKEEKNIIFYVPNPKKGVRFQMSNSKNAKHRLKKTAEEAKPKKAPQLSLEQTEHREDVEIERIEKLVERILKDINFAREVDDIMYRIQVLKETNACFKNASSATKVKYLSYGIDTMQDKNSLF